MQQVPKVKILAESRLEQLVHIPTIKIRHISFSKNPKKKEKEKEKKIRHTWLWLTMDPLKDWI